VTQHRKCPIFIIFLRRNIEKNSIELISKCAKTRLHQCRIKNWHPGPLLQRGEGRGRGRGNGRERGRETEGGRQLESHTNFGLKVAPHSSPIIACFAQTTSRATTQNSVRYRLLRKCVKYFALHQNI